MDQEPSVSTGWSEAERWVWEQINLGKIADFHERYGVVLDPAVPDDWDDPERNRRISQAFLVALLTDPPYLDRIPFQGVRIRGALVEEEIDLTHAHLGHQVWLEECRFQSTLNLQNLQISRWFSLEDSWSEQQIDLSYSHFGSHLSLSRSILSGPVYLSSTRIEGSLFLSSVRFAGQLGMSGMEIGGSLYMREQAAFEEIDMTAAWVDGFVDFSSSEVAGSLNMNGVEIGQGLFMRDGGSYLDVELTGARIDGTVDMSGSRFNGALAMSGVEIVLGLYMHNQASFQGVDLNSARIGGHMVTDNSTFAGQLTMESVTIGRSCYLRYTEFLSDRDVIMYYANIGATLDLSGARLSSLDLTGTVISGEFRLGSASGHEPTSWRGESRMNLRNASAGAIQDTPHSWPARLELEGFVYRNLGGFGAIGAADIQKRKKQWFIAWLARDSSFSPQPYEYLANLLLQSGYPSKANAILYASRVRLRKELMQGYDGIGGERIRAVGMLLLELTTGYGLGRRYFRVLWWCMGLTLLGFFVLRAGVEKEQWDLFRMLWASFDQVLPLVKFNDLHQELLLGTGRNWITAVFYIQKLVGYLLGGFLAAGLAGLTQKS